MYIALAPDGSYAVIAREHMFVRVEESGRWSKTGSRVVFIPTHLDLGRGILSRATILPCTSSLPAYS